VHGPAVITAHPAARHEWASPGFDGLRTMSIPDNSYLKDLILLRNDPTKVARIRDAAERGEVDAQYAMGLIYAEGRGVEIDLAQAHFWLSLAIAQGDRDADQLRNIVGSQMTDAEFAAAKALAIAHRSTHAAPSTRH
jgi:TPR repeat protein